MLDLFRIRTKHQRCKMAVALAKQLDNHPDEKVRAIALLIQTILGAPMEIVNVKLYGPIVDPEKHGDTVVRAEIEAASAEAQR